MSDSIPFEKIVAACERTARYRGHVAIEAGAPAGNLAERIDVLPDRATPVVGSDGWYRVGTVHDGVVNQCLWVLWHPETDRVRVGQPLELSPEPERVFSMPALSFNYYGARNYRASPNYRYFLNGREYTPAEAVRIATERTSVAGWTWEPVDKVMS